MICDFQGCEGEDQGCQGCEEGSPGPHEGDQGCSQVEGSQARPEVCSSCWWKALNLFFFSMFGLCGKPSC